MAGHLLGNFYRNTGRGVVPYRVQNTRHTQQSSTIIAILQVNVRLLDDPGVWGDVKLYDCHITRLLHYQEGGWWCNGCSLRATRCTCASTVFMAAME